MRLWVLDYFMRGKLIFVGRVTSERGHERQLRRIILIEARPEERNVPDYRVEY